MVSNDSTNASPARRPSLRNADLQIGARNATLPSGTAKPRGWHDRGYLPHFDGLDVTQHVTFHLADSLPAEVLNRLDAELERTSEADRERARRTRIQAWLDAGHGSCVLREPEIAGMMRDTLLYFHGDRYQLLAWVVMPNHVHVLFRPLGSWTMASAVASWKKHSAMEIMRYKRRYATQGSGVPSGVSNEPVWHREYWDRYMRDEDHLLKTVDYIRQNPVKAGLVTNPEDWPWSSAAGTPLS